MSETFLSGVERRKWANEKRLSNIDYDFQAMLYEPYACWILGLFVEI